MSSIYGNGGELDTKDVATELDINPELLDVKYKLHSTMVYPPVWEYYKNATGDYVLTLRDILAKRVCSESGASVKATDKYILIEWREDGKAEYWERWEI